MFPASWFAVRLIRGFWLLSVVAVVNETTAVAREPWSDPRLPPVNGLEVWFDATRATGPNTAVQTGPLRKWWDGSGKQRDLVQESAASAPTWTAAPGGPVVRFDGLDDHFTRGGLAMDLPEITLFVVATPFDNPGGYRGMMAINREGANDYVTGLNLDQGHAASTVFQEINVEGAGFGGERDLLASTHPFGTTHVISVGCRVGAKGVQIFVNGKQTGERDRQPGVLRMDRLTVGGRCYNHGGPASVCGFFVGDVAEVLLFSRTLPDEERKQVEEYLAAKHAGLLAQKTPRPQQVGDGHRLISLPAPPVQIFVPGFRARELPVALSNINNVRYRDDGKLVAVGYNGNIYLLTDTDGDGLEDAASLFWESQGKTRQPIGMALTPPGYRLGQGVFLPVVGKLSLIVDEDGDDRADREIVVADGWKPLEHQVDAFGVAIDPRDHSVYFGLGTENFANAYLLDGDGQSHYKLASERGTILRVAPDFKSREIVCTGIRFSVGLDFNQHGDLFCSEQEGATWLANGNPFDELLHIQPGRHYGFPPRHPRHLTGVIDEPSTFDYTPQHQSTCGLHFNEPVRDQGPTFGPKSWAGDALVTGYARGKLYRTQLVKTAAGYVAQNQLFGSLNALTVDATVSPSGNLVVATHSGGPDWGTGPSGPGKLYQIQYHDRTAPQPALIWAETPYEVRIAFDRPIPHEALTRIVERIRIEHGSAVAAGDRFEFHRPGYQIVHQQLNQPRYDLPVHGVQVMPDQRTIVVTTGEHRVADGYALTIFQNPSVAAALKDGDEDRVRQLLPSPPASSADIDLAYSLHGVTAEWIGDEKNETWKGWLPHPDPRVARALTQGSVLHEKLWKQIEQPGTLILETKLDLHSMLRPAVQPGSKLDYQWPAETTTVTWKSTGELSVVSGSNMVRADGGAAAVLDFGPDPENWIPLRVSARTGPGFALDTSWHTNEDARERPFPLRRFFLPWARTSSDSVPEHQQPPELAGGSWSRGRKVFFDQQVGCAKCHAIHGSGARIGPDLTNVVHRDYPSVLRDISEPSFAINPEYISQVVTLHDGRILTGVPRQDGNALLLSNDRGETVRLPTEEIESMHASTTSIMPKGLPQQLGPEKTRDLLTFLLTPGPRMPDYGSGRPPPARSRSELQAVLAGSEPIVGSRPLKMVLVAGPKDHGPGEHDYPAWQTVWKEWLLCAEQVTVETANPWPSGEQLSTADVLVFFQQGQWTPERARDLDRFQARGGGLVYLHYAVDGGRDPDGFATRIGLAWRGGASRFRHGELDLHFHRGSGHPIARNFDRVRFLDESYWQLVGDPQRVQVLATGMEDGQQQPLFWTLEQPAADGNKPSRVMVSILGHFSWTFDDPLFRLLILRGIAWTAHEPVDRFNDIVPLGARIE